LEINVKFGSVCSGIEAASVAWNGLGWKASWFAEIEQFPSAVLNHHYPEVPNLGDMTKLPEKILNQEIDAPDILCGGTPCQAFSVAGNRQSLDDARGNLTLTFCEIADALDTVRDIPAIIFWENVPGVLNTKDNAFGCFLARLAGEDSELKPSGKRWTNAGVVFGHKRTVAWRVLDAQYFGLAQRRKRVFVVASARERFDPAEILFEFEGLRRDIAPSRGERKNATSSIEDRSPDGCPTVGTLMARDYKGVVGALDTECGCSKLTQQSINNGHLITYGIQGNMIGRKPENGPQGSGYSEDISFTQTKADVHGVAYGFEPGIAKREGEPNRFIEEMTPTMRSQMGDNQIAVAKQMAVRRLTPRECERLQGFPDDYTKIPYRNKDSEKCPDGPRYKALGNSWAVPVVKWIGERIVKYGA
jgi:DNA (cytosine-5)-methyltransferase 1